MAAYTVVLIEDDPDVVELVTLGLAPQYRCLAATEGAAGLALAGTPGVAAVVLDLRLRGVDGLHVLAALRQAPATARLPVVVFSSSADQPAIVARLAGLAGAAPVTPVPKAAGIGGLRAALARLLEY